MEHIGYIIGKNIQLPNYLGMLVEGEDLTEYITLKMKKDETLEGLNYYLTYKNADGAGDTFALTKEITDKEILLSFVVTNAFTAVKGKMEIQVTGFEVADDPAEDDPVWKSFVATLTVARALHPEEIQPDTPTVFVQYLAQMQTLKEAAETAQGKAEDAQEAAETAQGKAEDAQEAAETAQGKAEDAQTAAETAQTAAETAQGKAETAQTKAETAQGKAETAQTKAETAQGKAEAAQTASEAAQGLAEYAQGKAEDAQTAAEAAQVLAEDAQTAAETAQGKAEDAQTAAETAQGLAEDARDLSQGYASDASDAKTAAQGYATDADNARIATVSETTSPDDGGTNTITFTYKDGTVKTFSVTNGHTGAPFAIYKTYASIAAMEADFANVPEGKFVIIASNTEDPDNAKLYVRGSSAFTFITDLSGAQGIQGPDGLAATIQVGTVTTGQPGSSATVTNTGTSSAAVFDFTIPKGDKGDTGSTGAAATIAVGSVQTGAAGTSASVTNSGTSSAAVFDFVIPKGDKGDTGSAGASAGFGTPTASVDANTGTPSVTITATGTDTAKVFDFAFKNLKGADGADGQDGQDGADGVGVPTGGTTGQILRKKSGTDYDTEWDDEQDISGKADKATTLAGYGITDAKISSGVITLGSDSITPITSHQDISGKADKATTLAGYGITDAKIASGVITLGSDTITPLTSHQDISGKADKSEMSVSTSGDKTTITLKSGTSAQVLNAHQSITGKADKVSGATTGNLAKLDSNGNLADSGIDSTKVLTESDVKDNTTTQSATKPLSANMGYSLKQEINTLKARGRFLSLWDCITGLPVSFPLSVPYAYMSGDYFIVSNSASYIKDSTDDYDPEEDYAVDDHTVYEDVLYKCNTAIVGGETWNSAHWDAVVDYIPTGSSYSGTASSVTATEEVFVNDTYVYDGTYWLHQVNTGGKVAFQNIAGNPDDNLALASKFANVVKHDSDIPGSATPINADQLNGHADTYFLPKSDVVDTLSSTATDKALSANQGKVLKDALSDIIKHTSLDLTTSSNGYTYYDFNRQIRIISVYLRGRNGTNVNGWMVGFSQRNSDYIYRQYNFVVYDNEGSNFGARDITVDVLYQEMN